jgi:hypothetical protein
LCSLSKYEMPFECRGLPSVNFRSDGVNYRGEQRYLGGIKIGVDLGEVWEIHSAYKKYEKIDI